MSTINGYDSNSISTLFSSLGTSSSSNSSGSLTDGLYSSLADYASIRNGSYSKLVKSYYALDDDSGISSANKSNDSKSTLVSIRDASKDLKESAQALYNSKSLFEKNADGEYDMEAIYEKVNAFIEDYNATIESVGSSETDKIANAGANLVNGTSHYADILDRMGISISATDYTLSIDKDAFMNANISDVTSAFSGTGSFAYQVGASASRINMMAADYISSASGSYSSSAGINASTSTSTDTASTIAKILEAANNLNSIGIDLYKNTSLFDTINGKYDTDKIVEEIKTFIDAYNELVEKAEASSSSSITSTVSSMTSITTENKSKLEKLGITVGDDNTLSLDADAFKQSNMSTAEKLFTGTGSYAYQIAVKAAMAANQAETEAAKSNTYTEDGTYSNNYNTGSILNGTI